VITLYGQRSEGYSKLSEEIVPEQTGQLDSPSLNNSARTSNYLYELTLTSAFCPKMMMICLH